MSLTLDRCGIECTGDGDPQRLAQALLKQLPDVSKAIPIEEVALALDIQEIEERVFTGREAELITDAAKSAGRIGVRAGARPSRRRFSIAHELGHFLNDGHRPTRGGRFACTARDFASPFGEVRHARQEREANLFAIEVLTPRPSLARHLKLSAEIDQALKIASCFEVSIEAALRRYVDLHRETLAVAFSRAGRLRYVRRSDDFPWIPHERGDPIGEAPTIARSGDRVTSMDEVDPETWLAKPDSLRLFAQTLLQNDGYAATLLIAEPREDEEEDAPRFR